MCNIENLSNKVLDYKINKIDDYIDIIKKLESLSRHETNNRYMKFFSNLTLAQKLVEIGNFNKSNTSLLCNILSLIGNMYRRYKVEITNEIWNFYLSCINIKDAKYYVYLFLPIFPQFNTYKSKWEFICNMPNIPPKKYSRENFYALIKHYINDKVEIPQEYREQIIKKLYDFINEDKINDYFKNNCAQLITSLL